MYKSSTLKSGGPPVEFPKTIWTPTGGWYAENAMWKRNTAIIGAGLALATIYIFRSSAKFERRYNAGPIPVPSQSWAKNTTEDDPQYYEKLTSWKKNGPSFFERIFQNKDDFKEE